MMVPNEQQQRPKCRISITRQSAEGNKCIHVKKIKQLLKRLGIEFGALKSVADRIIYVDLKTERDYDKAFALLQNYKYKSNTELVLTDAEPVTLRKPPLELNVETIDQSRLDELVLNATCPLWNLTYKDQCEIKLNDIRKILRTLRRKCYLPKLLINQVRLYECPRLRGYRSKLEFTIGLSFSNRVCVGFNIGKFNLDKIVIHRTMRLPFMTDELEKLASSVEQEIESYVSKLPVYCKIERSGYWKQMIVRMNTENRMIVILVAAGSEHDAEIRQIAQEIIDKVWESIPIHCFYLKLLESANAPGQIIELRTAGGYLLENHLAQGKTFIMPSLSFFQPTIFSAKLMLEKIKQGFLNSFKRPERYILLDVCCGSGVWAISLVDNFSKVIGVDSSAESIKNARENADLNHCRDKVTFTIDQAEHFLPSALNSLVDDRSIVAIVDPPRAGLHANALRAIRDCSRIETLIFIACDYNQSKKNFIELCKDESKRFKGQPFVMFDAFGLDMFPHSRNVELCLLFVRKVSEDVRNCMNDILLAI